MIGPTWFRNPLKRSGSGSCLLRIREETWKANDDDDDDDEEKVEEDRSGDGGRVGSEAEVEPQG